MVKKYYTVAASGLGDVGIVWGLKGDRPSIVRIFLPVDSEGMDELILRHFPGALRRPHRVIDQVCMGIRKSLAGQEVAFSGKVLDMGLCKGFQRRVLMRVMRIPRGRVSTYGALAERVGVPEAARAVGNALAGNPYPLIIPCHRVIKADGFPGGFGGGPEIKKALLSREGVVFDARGRVLPQFIR